uniref:Uncharacterized protein n=1 Tax=Caenorhabditis japonica TaxID=281687 RepID=A0A8R1IJ73_CAEJA
MRGVIMAQSVAPGDITNANSSARHIGCGIEMTNSFDAFADGQEGTNTHRPRSDGETVQSKVASWRRHSMP